MLEVARSEPWSRELPQSAAGGAHQHTDGSDHDEQRLSLDRTETASQPEEPVMTGSQRERQHHVAEHSMKPKNDDGRWVTILRGPNPSEQRRNDEKEAKEHS